MSLTSGLALVGIVGVGPFAPVASTGNDGMHDLCARVLLRKAADRAPLTPELVQILGRERVCPVRVHKIILR